MLIHWQDGAPQAAISLIAQGDGASAANAPSEAERQSLLMIRELINSKLGMMGGGSADKVDPDEPNVNTPPSSVVLKSEINASVPDESSRPLEEVDDEDMLL